MLVALIANEFRYAKKLLNGTVKERNLFKALVVLTKYYHFEQKLSEAEVKNKLLSYIEEVEGVVPDKDLGVIISSNMSDKVHINNLDSITITKTEWETIQELGRTERERKLLFTLLCMYKVKVGLGYEDNGLLKIEYTKLNSMAHTTFTASEREGVFAYFMGCGLIELGMGQLAKRVKINYCRHEGEEIIVIDDFESFHIYYDLLRKGGRLVNCRSCDKLVLAKPKAPTKYCRDCATKKEQERKNRYKREHN